MPTATLKDIAHLAQVSVATTSLVLNGKSGISAETRTRVLEAASTLNYSAHINRRHKEQSNDCFRFLKIAKHGHTVNRDHNVFISDYIDGMSSEAGLRSYTMEVVSFDTFAIEEIRHSLLDAKINGAIILGTELNEEDIQLVQQLPLPTVLIDTFCDYIDADFVTMNNKDAVYKIIEHFVNCGFKNIGLIASSVQTINFRLRKNAFIDVMRDFSLPVNEQHILTVDSTFEGAYRDMRNFLNAGLRLPECFFCINDIISYGCIKAFREANIRIPEELSLIGFDNLPMSATMDPPLTTIDVSKQKIGAFAVRLLDEIIKSGEKQPVAKILVGAKLITRNSVNTRLNPK